MLAVTAELAFSVLIFVFGVALAATHFVAARGESDAAGHWWTRIDGQEGLRRRNSRRSLGMAIVLVIAFSLLLGSALLDHTRSPSQFAWYWLAVLILVAWLCILALIDISHTLRVLRTWNRQDIAGSTNRYIDPTAGRHGDPS